jgi:4-amino-4-deoxy-L-arabinose transferase-like glycosyltransferase
MVIGLAWLLPGIVGHEPWKPDEGYVFGSINEMLASGDWVVPQVGGEPFMEKPPAYHWLALATATIATPLLSLHDGARIASVLFLLLTLASVALATRWTAGPTHAPAAVLLVLACLGLPDPAHMIVPDLPQLAGCALALAGLAGQAAGRRAGGLLFGTGAGLAFLGKGLLVPGILAVTVLLLPVLFGAWRNRRLLPFLGAAVLAALPWLLLWPLAIHLRSPDLFGHWFWDNNIGRFIGTSVASLGAANEPGLFWRSTPWFLFPAWLFAAVSLFRAGRNSVRGAQFQIALVFLAVAAVTLSQSGSLRTVYLLPLIPAVAMMGADAVVAPPRWLSTLLGVAGIAIALLALGLFWPVWFVLISDGQLPAWGMWLGKWLPTAFAMPWQPLAASGAVALSLAAIIGIGTLLRGGRDGLRLWLIGLTLAWGLLMTLWLPWLDEAKSYRKLFTAAAAAVPADSACVASRDLGESERALLNYYGRLTTRRLEAVGDVGCPLLLVQSRAGKVTPAGEAWSPLWAGARPGDPNESFQLYRRPTGP